MALWQIVIDDGSTDATPEILARLADEYPSLTVVTGAALPNCLGLLRRRSTRRRSVVAMGGESEATFPQAWDHGEQGPRTLLPQSGRQSVLAIDC